MVDSVTTTQPNDYTLIRCSIIGYDGSVVDIGDKIYQLDIYEDIFNSHIRAVLIMNDPESLIESLPMIGEERVHIKFSTSQTQGFYVFDKVFNVYRVSDLKHDRKSTFYSLHLTTPIVALNGNNRISKSYSGHAHEIVDKIYKQTLGLSDSPLLVESTKYKYENIVIPNWQPLRTINYFASTAIKSSSDTDDVSDFVFFENKVGHSFTSLTTLFESDVSDTLIDLYEDGQNKNMFNGVQKRYIPHVYDNAKNQLLGTYANKVYVEDIITKTLTEKEYQYSGSKVVSEPNITKNRVGYVSTNYKSNAGAYTSQHDAQINQVKHGLKVVVEMPGNSDMTLGTTVKYKINKDVDDGIGGVHAIFPTKYLITKVRHSLFNGNYTMSLELTSKEWRVNKNNV